MPANHLVLVNPPQTMLLDGFSTGLTSLANFVATHSTSVSVHLLDLAVDSADAGERRIKEALKDKQGAVVVGITTTTASYQSGLSVARTFKRHRSESFLVLGGHHASAQDDVILKKHFPLVNAVIRGEGEFALLELLRSLPDLSHVPNLSYVQNGEIHRTPAAPYLNQAELDDIGLTFGADAPRAAPGKFDHVTYVSARGCPLQCSFCSVANQKIRAKSVSRVIADLRYLAEKLAFRNVAIEDNFFAHSPRRTVELCTAISNLQMELSRPLSWDCQTRVESLQSSELLTSMERAGCDAVYLGVEALTREDLSYLGKTNNPAGYLRTLTEKTLPLLFSSSIKPYVNLQLGLPTGRQNCVETSALLRSIGKHAKQTRKTITVFPQLHVVYPGTTHFCRDCQDGAYGKHSAEVFEPFTEWEFQRTPILQWLGNHFAHGTGGIPKAILHSDKLRSGAFEVDAESVLQIDQQLNEWANLDGIEVFRYGEYLTGV